MDIYIHHHREERGGGGGTDDGYAQHTVKQLTFSSIFKQKISKKNYFLK